jgi:hypothetical protein
LLPGNGTNGAQNNTFLDGSTNNFTITRNGNTTQGTFSPFSQTGWGNYFSASTDNLVGPSVALATNDFTLECWFYATRTTYQDFTYLIAIAVSGNNNCTLQFTGTANQVAFTGGFGVIFGTFTANTWNHIAGVRNGNNFKLYINGNSQGTPTTSSYSIPSNPVLIGGLTWAGGYQFDGYISNARVVNGVAVYTGNFTPPTSPLAATQSAGTNISAITGTSTALLTCQSNRFKDNSTFSNTITRNGSVSVVAFSPFNPTASWSAAAYGGSGYFDGSGDYLSVADNANLRFGTSAFTIQAWIYRNASGTAHSIIAKGGASTGYVLQVTSTNVLRFTHGTTNVDTTTTIPASAWTHVAAVRTNTSTNGFQLYINGVSSATATVSTDFNQTDTLYIGGDRSAANVMNGYISGLKYTNGTAETISVPTEPPTATTNVVLLANFTNAGIYDATSKNDLETLDNTVNGVRISTAQSQFGGSSIYFDGTGTDYLWIQADQPIQRFGTAPFTIELWIRLAALGSARGLVAKGTSTTGWLVSLNSSNQVVFTYGTSTITSTGTISQNVWTYIAVVREGTGSNQTKIYIGGTNDGTGTVSTDFTQTSSMYIGANRTGGDLYSGYIQDVRITNGYARTVTTIPTSAFPTL